MDYEGKKPLNIHLGPDAVPRPRNGGWIGQETVQRRVVENTDIVALINYNCTSDPVGVFVIWTRGNSFVAQELTTEHGTIENTFVDIDGDGKCEILLQTSTQAKPATRTRFTGLIFVLGRHKDLR